MKLRKKIKKIYIAAQSGTLVNLCSRESLFLLEKFDFNRV